MSYAYHAMVRLGVELQAPAWWNAFVSSCMVKNARLMQSHSRPSAQASYFNRDNVALPGAAQQHRADCHTYQSVEPPSWQALMSKLTLMWRPPEEKSVSACRPVILFPGCEPGGALARAAAHGLPGTRLLRWGRV